MGWKQKQASRTMVRNVAKLLMRSGSSHNNVAALLSFDWSTRFQVLSHYLQKNNNNKGEFETEKQGEFEREKGESN
jgi:hypothetical protein